MTTEQTPNEAPASSEAVDAPQGAQQPSLEDYAAREYQTLLPRFRQEMESITGTQAKNVAIALMEYPLEKIDFEWTCQEAQRAFVTGATIMDCRFVLMKALIELTADEKRAILDETKDDVPMTVPNEGETNVGSV